MIKYLSFIILSLPSLDCACSRNYGPAGNYQCIKIGKYYTGYQYATCLTHTYIQQKSGFKHACRQYLDLYTWTYKYPTYCWYQCQLELNGKDTGAVDANCKCVPNQVTIPTKTTINSNCYSPPGDQCSWYSTCFETKYSCSNTLTSYLLQYDRQFCQVYDFIKNVLSFEGRQWVDSTRKCLQVSLAPVLKQWLNFSCKDIENKILESYKCCYMGNSSCTKNGTLSVCQLPNSDFVKLFFELTNQLKNKKDFASVRSLYELFDLSNSCNNGTNLLTKNLQLNSKMRQIGFELERQSRFVSPITENQPLANHEAAFLVGTFLANQWKSTPTFLRWFVYGVVDNSTTLNIRIVLYEDTHPFVLSVNGFVTNLLDDIEKGLVWIENIPYEGSSLKLKSATVCVDSQCKKTKRVALPPSIRPSTTTTTTTTTPPTTTTTTTATPTTTTTTTKSYDQSLRCSVWLALLAVATMMLLF